MIRHLGLDVFSRSCYSDQQAYWFGGLCEEIIEGGGCRVDCHMEGADTVTCRTYTTAKGVLSEQLRYVARESTVVQERFLIEDPSAQLEVLTAWVQARRWRLDAARYRQAQAAAGDDGFVVAGELTSPLKLLHLVLGPIQTVYLAADHPERVHELCALHEQAQLDLVRQMAEAGVPAMMTMDNLDAVFHPPHYIERFSASFYEQASRICHAHGSTFWIHACGQQRAILPLICSLGVDGLEGVTYPPLGDVSLADAFEMTADRFLITGGISAAEFESLQTRAAVDAYVRRLLRDLWPHRHRFILSASCNTPITARYEQIVWFRDAWLRYREGS